MSDADVVNFGDCVHSRVPRLCYLRLAISGSRIHSHFTYKRLSNEQGHRRGKCTSQIADILYALPQNKDGRATMCRAGDWERKRERDKVNSTHY